MKERQRDNNINKRLQFIGTAHTAPTRHRATRTLPHAPLSAFFSLRPFAARRPAPGRHKRQGDTPPDLGRASPAAPVPADPPRAAVRTPYNRTVFNRQLSEQSPGCRRPQSRLKLARLGTSIFLRLGTTWDGEQVTAGCSLSLYRGG